MTDALDWLGAVVLGFPSWLASIPAPVWTLAGAVVGAFATYRVERYRQERQDRREDSQRAVERAEANEARRRDRYAELIRSALGVHAAHSIQIDQAWLSPGLLSPVAATGDEKKRYKERRIEEATLAFRSAHALALLEPSSKPLSDSINKLERVVLESPTHVHREVRDFTVAVNREFGKDAAPSDSAKHRPTEGAAGDASAE